MPEGKENLVRVYVDAKIEGMHNPELPKTTYVGYYVESLNLHDAKRVDANETDDAEIQAILFAIDALRGNFNRFRVVCDHQSVVSEAIRDSVKKPSPLLENLRRVLHENPGISLEALQTNLAHKSLTEYVNRAKQSLSL